MLRIGGLTPALYERAGVLFLLSAKTRGSRRLSIAGNPTGFPVRKPRKVFVKGFGDFPQQAVFGVPNALLAILTLPRRGKVSIAPPRRC